MPCMLPAEHKVVISVLTSAWRWFVEAYRSLGCDRMTGVPVQAEDHIFLED